MEIVAKKYLALGDSYTIGECVLENERFPVQSVTQLRNLGIDISDPTIIAATGWTTSDLFNSLETFCLTDSYDIVTLLIGVNNQYQGKSLADYKVEFTQLLQLAISYAGNTPEKVFVLSIPDYGVTPFAASKDPQKIAQEIDAFNEVNKMATLCAGVHYIDITPVSREAESDQLLIADDGLHPSGKQYGRWSDLLVEEIRKICFEL